MIRSLRYRTGRDLTAWPVLLLLLLVLVPTVCLFALMQRTIESERLAVRQRLADVYRSELESVRDRIDDAWRDRLAELDELIANHPAAEAFAVAARGKLADGLIVLDSAGQPAYPTLAAGVNDTVEITDPRWREGQALEFGQVDFGRAIDLYREVASAHADQPAIAARALVATTRCLVHLGKHDEAIDILLETLQEDRFNGVRDEQGRLVQLDAALRGLQLAQGNDGAGSQRDAAFLVARLNNYGDTTLTARQRRFLMGEVAAFEPAARFPTLAAEDLAARYLESQPAAGNGDGLHPTADHGVWRVTVAQGIALFQTRTVTELVRPYLDPLSRERDFELALVSPHESSQRDEAFLVQPLGAAMPHWHLLLRLDDTALFDTATNERVAAYVWQALLVLAIMVTLALLVGGAIGRQTRLARLKNDLVANVSHELKTPLASIRLLVDTLLDDGQLDGRAREYLQLVSQENARLTRLIENFLTFSRMERGKHRFDFRRIDVRAVVAQAVEAVADRFDTPESKLVVQTDDELPAVHADPDALVTVVVNLLENAHKYSGDEKRVTLRVTTADERLRIAVADNGIGLSPRAARRVFDRFYQVDERLSRTQGGCGLGLSIVRYIVEAHGGQVSVTSQPGAGSTFTVDLPYVGINHGRTIGSDHRR